jgi:hypothetical protein
VPSRQSDVSRRTACASPGYNLGVTKRAWLIPLIALVLAVALFVAGVVEWRMFSPACDTKLVGCRLALPPPHRLHPLRAELLWAASAFFGLVALGVGLWAWRRWGAGRKATV